MSTQRLRFRSAPLVIAGVFLLLTAMKTTAVAQADVEEKNRRSVQTAFDNWRRRAGTVFDLLASDAKWTIVGLSAASGTYQSRRDLMDQVVIPFNARLSTPLVPTVRAIYADGDTVIVLWDGAAIDRDGKSYENTYSWYLKMRDGKIISAIALFDSIAFDDLWKRVRPVY
ncbi:MAG TPA: nuclear transport factor 2 family protein [Pyrinomonadaceae bacterium]|jgi:ketosteroid isomerase-like protein|nr:nuclear transport factor 2 family protein [Pyrinomonadaceae bacterium]